MLGIELQRSINQTRCELLSEMRDVKVVLHNINIQHAEDTEFVNPNPGALVSSDNKSMLTTEYTESVFGFDKANKTIELVFGDVLHSKFFPTLSGTRIFIQPRKLEDTLSPVSISQILPSVSPPTQTPPPNVLETSVPNISTATTSVVCEQTSPVESPENEKEIQLLKLKEKILSELKKDDMEAESLKKMIDELGKLSLFDSIDLYTTFEEILKILAGKLRHASDLDAFVKFMKVTVEVIWKMRDWNSTERTDNKELRDGVIQLWKELLDIDVKVKRIISKMYSNHRSYSIECDSVNDILKNPNLSEENRKILTDNLQELKNKYEIELNALKDQINTIGDVLQELSQEEHG